MWARWKAGDIVSLHQLQPGPASCNYGVNVALPAPREVLETLYRLQLQLKAP